MEIKVTHARPDTMQERLVLSGLRAQLAPYRPLVEQLRQQIPPRIAERLDALLDEIEKDSA